MLQIDALLIAKPLSATYPHNSILNFKRPVPLCN
jgi:hypothetical protein